ncbi:MAG: hypothetical protein JXR23_01250 [Pontiellaceae bacterium]|nr:hypothetical protein [Pontiellaceae bacterium]
MATSKTCMSALCSFILISAATVQTANAQTKETASRTVEDGGTGSLKALMVSDSSLPEFTVFRPKDMDKVSADKKLPIIVWGNGGCANSPSGHLNFLSEVASHGYLIVAIGPMPQEGARGGGMGGGAAASDKPQLIQAIDWAIAQSSDEKSIYFNKLDTKKIAVSGMSCGGIQALEAAPDPRVTTAMICNSGIFNSSGGPGGGGGMGGMPSLSKDHLKKLHSSIIYILGGPDDIAYANGMDDYEQIENLPAVTANLADIGHGGTYMQPHGGTFAVVATAWLNWQLKGDKEAAKMFVGEDCGLEKMEGWSIQKKNLDAIAAPEAGETKETASRTVEDGGTGPFKAVMVSDSSLPAFTVFRPKDMDAVTKDKKLPIIAWGNGGCANSPSGHLNFLSEVASQGYLIVAIGPIPQEGAGGGRPGGGMPAMGGGMPAGMPQMGGGGMPPMGGGMPSGMPQMGGGGMPPMGGGAPAGGNNSGTSEKSQLIQAIDWAVAQNSNPKSIYYQKLDVEKVAVSGMSCGGLQALEAAPDPRVTTAMICNSGIINSDGGGGGGMGGMPALNKDHLKKLHGSIIYILGGPDDIAYVNGMDDFEQIEKLPAVTANLADIGHGGTYMQPHGGTFAVVASAWLDWQLKGDKEAAKMFQGDDCGLEKMEGWSIQKKNID